MRVQLLLMIWLVRSVVVTAVRTIDHNKEGVENHFRVDYENVKVKTTTTTDTGRMVSSSTRMMKRFLQTTTTLTTTPPIETTTKDEDGLSLLDATTDKTYIGNHNDDYGDNNGHERNVAARNYVDIDTKIGNGLDGSNLKYNHKNNKQHDDEYEDTTNRIQSLEDGIDSKDYTTRRNQLFGRPDDNEFTKNGNKNEVFTMNSDKENNRNEPMNEVNPDDPNKTIEERMMNLETTRFRSIPDDSSSSDMKMTYANKVTTDPTNVQQTDDNELVNDDDANGIRNDEIVLEQHGTVDSKPIGRSSKNVSNNDDDDDAGDSNMDRNLQSSMTTNDEAVRTTGCNSSDTFHTTWIVPLEGDTTTTVTSKQMELFGRAFQYTYNMLLENYSDGTVTYCDPLGRSITDITVTSNHNITLNGYYYNDEVNNNDDTPLLSLPVSPFLLLNIDVSCPGGCHRHDEEGDFDYVAEETWLFDDYRAVDGLQPVMMMNETTDTCTCPDDAILGRNYDTFSLAFLTNIMILRITGDLDFVTQIGTMQPVLEIPCSTSEEPLSYSTVLNLPVVQFPSYLMKPGLVDQREIEQLFQETYHSILYTLCDPTVSTITKVQILSIASNPNSDASTFSNSDDSIITFQLDIGCRGMDCSNNQCPFASTDIEFCIPSNRRTLTDNPLNIGNDRSPKRLRHPNSIDGTKSRVSTTSASTTTAASETSSTKGFDMEQYRKVLNVDTDEYCYCTWGVSKRVPKQEEFQIAFQLGLDRLVSTIKDRCSQMDSTIHSLYKAECESLLQTVNTPAPTPTATTTGSGGSDSCDSDDMFATTVVVVFVGDASAATEDQLQLFGETFQVTYNELNDDENIDPDQDTSFCDPYDRNIETVQATLNVTLSGIYNSDVNEANTNIQTRVRRRLRPPSSSSFNFFDHIPQGGKKLPELLNTTVPSRVNLGGVLLYITGSCRGCRDDIALFDDVSDSYFRRDRALQGRLQDDTCCPKDAVLGGADEFTRRFDDSIEDLQEDGQLEFITAIQNTIPVTETNCSSNVGEYSITYKAEDYYITSSVLDTAKEELGALFRDTYNNQATQLCDPKFRTISSAEITAPISQENDVKEEDVFLATFVVEVKVSCRGDDCPDNDCLLFDDAPGCTISGRGLRDTTKKFALFSNHQDRNIEMARFLLEEDDGAERCFCFTRGDVRSVTQGEFRDAFQIELDKLFENTNSTGADDRDSPCSFEFNSTEDPSDCATINPFNTTVPVNPPNASTQNPIPTAGPTSSPTQEPSSPTPEPTLSSTDDPTSTPTSNPTPVLTTLSPATSFPVTAVPITDSPITPTPVIAANITAIPMTLSPLAVAPATAAPNTPAPVTSAPAVPRPTFTPSSSSLPSSLPSGEPSFQPSNPPTVVPSIAPSGLPSHEPSMPPTELSSCSPFASGDCCVAPSDGTILDYAAVYSFCRSFAGEDRCCFDGNSVSTACSNWTAAETNIICKGACRGDGACVNWNQGNSIGINSCQGDSACQGLGGKTVVGTNACTSEAACLALGSFSSTSIIGDNSCQGVVACELLGVFSAGGIAIGANSCSGDYACFGLDSDNVRSIGVDSCVGPGACDSVAYIGGSGTSIEGNSCQGLDACSLLGTNGAEIAIAGKSCLGDLSCYSVGKSVDFGKIKIENDSCYDYASCYGVGCNARVSVTIGEGACSKSRACEGCECDIISEVEIPALLDVCGDAFNLTDVGSCGLDLPPSTASPVAPTELPVTTSPTLSPAPSTPITSLPATNSPVPTSSQVTPQPVSQSPMSVAPVTIMPIFKSISPITPIPVTPSPVTSSPVTPSPILFSPVTQAPDVSLAPVTKSPITLTPITALPDTASPATPSLISSSPITQAPITASPMTLSPVTTSPVTLDPVSLYPVTSLPMTLSPIKESPVTISPITNSPITTAPITAPPITSSPVTSSPNTPLPVTSSPVSSSPITPLPVTRSPITPAPVTLAPMTTSPITGSPITAPPVTSSPITSSPVTASPVTVAPML